MESGGGVLSIFGLGLKGNAVLASRYYFTLSLKRERCLGMETPRESLIETVRCLQKGMLHLILHLGVCLCELADLP